MITFSVNITGVIFHRYSESGDMSQIEGIGD